MKLPYVKSATLDPILDTITIEFEDSGGSVGSIEDALFQAGYVVDRLLPGG